MYIINCVFYTVLVYCNIYSTLVTVATHKCFKITPEIGAQVNTAFSFSGFSFFIFFLCIMQPKPFAVSPPSQYSCYLPSPPDLFLCPISLQKREILPGISISQGITSYNKNSHKPPIRARPNNPLEVKGRWKCQRYYHYPFHTSQKSTNLWTINIFAEDIAQTQEDTMIAALFFESLWMLLSWFCGLCLPDVLHSFCSYNSLPLFSVVPRNLRSDTVKPYGYLGS